MSLIEHAKKELELAGFFDKDSDYDGMLGTATMELIELLSKQGHSGYSGSCVLDLFTKLANFKPLSPLTFDDSEWIHINDHDGGIYQNNRNSCVFKESKDGKPYYIDAFVMRTPSGICWQGRLNLEDGTSISRCFIKDSKNMPTIIIDIFEEEVSKDNWKTWIKDMRQLEELAIYYEFNFQ